MNRIKEIISSSINLKQKILEDESFLKNILLIINKIFFAIKDDKKILLMGNGGSAADCQHFAGEFINRFLINRAPLPAIALSTDSSVLTCIANDFSFDEIFEKQISALGNKGDILIGISTSGNSKNIVKGFKKGKELGTINIGLLGKDGGKAKDYCDISLIVPSEDTPRIQEIHELLIHIICEIIERRIFHENNFANSRQRN